MTSTLSPDYIATGTAHSVWDGKEYIVIHPKAYTEIGRLLSGVANTPFLIPNLPGTDDYGNYPNYYNAVKAFEGGKYDAWINGYYHNSALPITLTSADRKRLCFWLECKLNQFSYMDDLLGETKVTQRLVFVQENVIISEDGDLPIKTYSHIPSHDFLCAHLQSRRYKLHEIMKRRNSASDKKNR